MTNITTKTSFINDEVLYKKIEIFLEATSFDSVFHVNDWYTRHNVTGSSPPPEVNTPLPVSGSHRGQTIYTRRNDLSIFGIVLFVFWYSNTYCIHYFSSPVTSVVSRPTSCLCPSSAGCPFHGRRPRFSQITI